LQHYPETVGIAGCGRMGLPMAEALSRAGIKIFGFDVRPRSEFDSFKERMIEDPQAFARKCDIVFTVVRDTRQTNDLLFDQQAMLHGDHNIRTVVICSTLSPRYLTEMAAMVPGDITLVDAPMSGGAIAAQEARLSFMLGGDEGVLDRLQPLFEVMGKNIHRMGGFRAGMTAKVLNNFAAASSLVASRQVFEWADKLGVDRDRLLALMHDSSGQNWFASNFELLEFARDGYDNANTIGIIKKDVESMLDAVGVDPETALPGAIIENILALKPIK
jgi:3-hydroxyisobutyrate dehydrogenase-like beta-hydroxyacid dehydrogenase